MAEIGTGQKLNNSRSNSEASRVNVPLGFTIEIVIVLILFENLTILLTLRLFKKWKAVDLLVLSLSLADFINAGLPLQLLNVKVNFVSGLWSAWLCWIFIWATYSLRIASLSTVTLMSVEQALLLYKPLRHHTQMTVSFMRKNILLTWGISVITSTLPQLFDSPWRNGEKSHCRYQPFNLGLAFGIFIQVFGLIQFAIVFGSYVILVYSSRGFHRRQTMMAAWRQSNQRGVVKRTNGRSSQGSSLQRRKFRQETQGMMQVRQLCRGMAYVVFLYYVSWLPLLVSTTNGRSHTLFKIYILLQHVWNKLGHENHNQSCSVAPTQQVVTTNYKKVFVSPIN